MATTEAVEAVVRHVTYVNDSFAGHISINNLAPFADRTVSFRITDSAASGTPLQDNSLSLPGCFGRRLWRRLRTQRFLFLNLFGIFSNGDRKELNSDGVEVGFCSEILAFDDAAGSSFGFKALHTEPAGGVCYVTFSLGGLSTGNKLSTSMKHAFFPWWSRNQRQRTDSAEIIITPKEDCARGPLAGRFLCPASINESDRRGAPVDCVCIGSTLKSSSIS